jgi:triose/dihydroxyacetone kinase / FAD-AMP lyase (cyclizing)
MVLKIIGALAEQGGSLDQVYKLAQHVCNNLVSVGSSMEHVHVPGRGPMESLMPLGDIEVGMGIHNEPGSQTVRADLPELIKIMLAQLLDPQDKDRYYVDFKKDDQVVLFVNNLGGVSMLEIGGIVAELVKQLKSNYNIVPLRVLAGTYLTSLNGLGFSASLLRLADTGLGSGKSMLELLDFPAEAYGWAAPISPSTWEAKNEGTFDKSAASAEQAASQKSNLTLDPSTAHKALEAGLQKVIAAEAEVTRYDTIVGDGDCGIGLKRGAEAVLKDLSSGNLPTDAVAFVNRIVPVVEENMDGTSGAIYAIFLNALAAGVRAQDSAGGSSKAMDASTWAAALTAALGDLKKYTPAAPGDRTLMDALFPFVETLKSSGDVKQAAQKAKEGAEATKSMKASLGRAVYVGAEDEWRGKVPDPGAWGLQEFLIGFAEAL